MQPTSGVLQRTPPEIWLSIFECATFVPHAFDTDVTDPFDVHGSPTPFDHSVERRLQASLSTKRSLVLVCKLWHDLATPLLYQAVTARDNVSLRSLNNAISGHSSASRKLRVRRLDLLRWPRNQTPLASDVLSELLHQLPSVEILCLATYPYFTTIDSDGCDLTRAFDAAEAESLLEALLAAPVRTTLRKCIIGPSFIHVKQSNALLSHCTRLSCLFVFSHIRYPFREGQVIPARLPLTCLSVECEDTPSAMASGVWHQMQPHPSLQHVHILLRSIVRIYHESTETFLRTQGVYLRTIQLSIGKYQWDRCVAPFLHLLATHCPNLIHLIFICDSRGPVLFRTPLPPTVTHFGIYSMIDNSEQGLCDYLGQIERFLGQRCHVPGVIRRLNASTQEEWDYLREDPELLARYAALPVPSHCRLEDAEGRDLMLRMRSSLSS
ncbi:hypothetical protein DENSPDRAFT_619446 [Dentipellis sp. KUC8613]|nr:hypothetical protein DENSPDRAFT_619446 [Dentipellis sp. KUC8613]